MRRLSHKEKGFIKEFAETNDATTAVLNNYDTEDKHTAASIAWENLKKPEIIEALRKLGFDSNNAKAVVAEILNDETNEPKDRLKASEIIFKVHGDMAPDKLISLSATVDLTPTPRLQHLADKLNK